MFWWTVTRWNCWKIKRLKFAGANHWSFAELFTALPLIATKKKIRLIKISMFLHLYCQTGDLNNFNINSDRPNVENWCEFNLANRFWQEKRSIWRFACFFIIYLIFSSFVIFAWSIITTAKPICLPFNQANTLDISWTSFRSKVMLSYKS